MTPSHTLSGSHRTESDIPAELYRALTLEERAHGIPVPSRAHANGERGLRRLAAWKGQRPFASGPRFGERLAALGIDEARLLALLSDSDDDLRGRHPALPGWMAELAAAGAADGDTIALRIPDSVERRAEYGFLLAVRPLLVRAQTQLRDGVAEIAAGCAHPALRADSLVEVLSEEMVHAVLTHLCRTMVLELHVAGLEGSLAGTSGAERFREFVERFREPAARAALFAEYPVLGRTVASALDRYVTTNLEFTRRLATDWDEICQIAALDAAGEIVEIRAAGDPHRGGRGVLIIRFASGLRVVYKPKPLAVDLHFQELLEWLNERGWDSDFRTCRILDQGDYGWMEFLRPEPCTSEAAVGRFYRRIGGYLAVLYAVGATDMHFENMVAVGEQPMLIDLETLFHPALVGTSPDLGTARVNREIARSVLSVGMLPERLALGGDAGEVDVSGLGARGDQLSPLATPQWVGGGTDEMRLERVRTLMPLGEHLPALRDLDHKIDFVAYIDDVLGGFADMYRLLARHRAELLAPDGPVERFRDDPIRVVLRPTQDYYAIYRESGHPDLLRDALDLDAHLDRLWAAVPSHPELARIVPLERADLSTGDIPVFLTRPGSKDLWTGAGVRVADYLDETGLDLVRARLANLGGPDFDRQLWLVRATLASAVSGGESVDAPRSLHLSASRPLVGATPLALACAVGDRLVALALRADGHASWLSETPTGGGGFAIRPMGTDLYSGLAGVGLFLATLGNVTGDARYLELARETLCSIRAQVKGRTGATSIGGFGGWGSVVYTLSHLAALLDEPELESEAEELAAWCAESISSDDQLDVLSGSAGLLLAALSVYRVKGSERMLAVARQCGDRLLETARPAGPGVGWIIPSLGEEPIGGLSHGAAGMALALLRLAEVSGETRYRDTAIAAIRYERSLFDPACGNWRDLRATIGAADEPMSAWCHGAAGIGLARLAGLGCLDDADVREEIERAVESTLRAGFSINHSLCHGALGNLELPLVAAAATQRPDWRAAVDAASRQIGEHLTSYGPLSGSLGGLETPGFMNGLAGIGYGLLRLAHPDRVASVLVLEPATRSTEAVR